MNIDFAPELESFRCEVAEFFATAPTPPIREAGRKTTSVFAPFKECMEWHRILFDKGWVAPHWPKEHGGTGWSVEQRFIFAEEYRKADLPPLLAQSLGGLVTVLRRSPISLCHLGLECERADAAQI